MTKEELEKEAEEYADWFWGASPSVMRALAKAYIEGAEPRERRIEELEQKLETERSSRIAFVNNIITLEKENAELKEYNKYLKRKRQGGIQKQYNKVSIIKQQEEQLAKAKKIIKTLLRLWNGVMTEDTVKALISEAEQFLKENE